jgi:hypothetical protein
VLLKNDQESLSILWNILSNYYNSISIRAYIFNEHVKPDGSGISVSFLVDRKWVVKYDVINDVHAGFDRWVGGLHLSIGGFFFGPGQFWSEEKSMNFLLEPDEKSIIQNLMLLDDFFSG